MARTDPQFNLRIPQELKEQIEKSAKDDGRSINAQAVYLLQKGLKKPPTQTISPFGIDPQTPTKKTKRYIFTEWHYLENDDNHLIHNENARVACSDYMTKFFKDYPEHELVKFEFMTEKTPKDREIIRGIRIWYSY